MNALERLLLPPVAAIRPYLALKGTLLLLALDLWLTRASHAGRYGAGGFNVAHFDWLDRMLPSVSPALYVGVCVLTGLLCFVIALTPRAPRALIALTFALHTASWAMSMLDSYQHHYLLSLVLLALIFMPPLRSEDILRPAAPEEAPPPAEEPPQPKRSRRKGKRRASAERRAKPAPTKPPGVVDYLFGDPAHVASWGWTLLAWSIAVVYLYTAFSKSDPEWLSGAALKRVLHLPASGEPRAGALDPIGPARMMLGWIGLEGEAMWRAMGRSVVLVQIVCAMGYLLAPFREVLRHWIVDVLFAVALLTALSFHLGAEYMGLQIGWFSWYMVGYALLFMLPWQVVLGSARLLLPAPEGASRSELLMIRIGLFLFLGLVVGTSATWSEWSPFDVSLAGIFGAGFNQPMALMLGALVLALPLMLMLRVHTVSEAALRKAALGALGFGAFASVVAGASIDLPGAFAAGATVAVGLGAAAIALLLFRAPSLPFLGAGLGALLGALALFSSVAFSEVRWDYYRNVGGDHRRRGELSEAYVAYVKATRYAPEGESRQERIDQVRTQLEAAGEPIPTIAP